MSVKISARFFDRNPFNLFRMLRTESEIKNAFPEWDLYPKEMYWFDEQISSEPDWEPHGVDIYYVLSMLEDRHHLIDVFKEKFKDSDFFDRFKDKMSDSLKEYVFK
jgi:hypothetical protein